MNEADVRVSMDLCNCMMLRKASRRTTQFYDAMLAPAGVRVTQYGMLALLSRGKLSVNELAKRLELDRTTTGKNLRPLERDGLVKVAPSATDRRTRSVTLTRKGLILLKTATPLWRAAQREFVQTNGAQTVAALRDMLSRLTA